MSPYGRVAAERLAPRARWWRSIVVAPLLAGAACHAPPLEPPAPVPMTTTAAPSEAVPGRSTRSKPPAPVVARAAPEQRTEKPTGEGETCDLPDTAVEAIRFAPQEFNLNPPGEQTLEGLLACERAGLLGEHRLRVIGFTDPRGSAEYNYRLGLARAGAVERYLLRRGMPARLLEVVSVGEQCHLGTGPESWRLDRRVEIHLLLPDAPEPGCSRGASDPARH